MKYKRLFDLLQTIIDDEVGILSNVVSLPRQADMPNFFYYKAIVANTGEFGGEENRPVSGGTSIERERALAKAVGEGIERYSSAIYHYDELPFGNFNQYKSLAVEPREFATFSPNAFLNKGFPFHSFDESTSIHWSKAINLHNNQEVLIPACMVYCPYKNDDDNGEPPITETISTGLASHLSFEEAALNGILEVVERDNFMLTWLCKDTPPKIDKQSLNPNHLDMLNRFASFGYEIELLDNRKDAGIPCVIAVMKGAYVGSVPFLIAAATHLNPAEAITKCLEELALIERYGKRAMLTASEYYPYQSYNHVVNLIDHVRFWLDPNVANQCDFLLDSEQFIKLQDIPNASTDNVHRDLNHVVGLIHATGHNIYISDITTSDIQQLGFKVVRALIPGYLPLNKRHDCVTLKSDRLDLFLRNKVNQEDINPLPHPFA